MQKEINIRVVPEVAYQAKELKQHVARELGLDVRSISAVQVRRRSIDARQRTVYVNLSLMVYVGEEPCAAFEPVAYREVHDSAPVIVVGAGPGGLFAALRLIELGKRPIVLERGRDVHSRRKDIGAQGIYAVALEGKNNVLAAKKFCDLFHVLHLFLVFLWKETSAGADPGLYRCPQRRCGGALCRRENRQASVPIRLISL